MINSKPTNSIQNIIYSIFFNHKLKYLALVSVTSLASLKLSAQDIALETKKTENSDLVTGFERPALQHLFLKVQINPPYNQNVSSYAGLPVHVLSSNGELIAAQALDKNGQVRFDQLTKAALKKVQIYSAATGDKVIVENPSGAVVAFPVSSPDEVKDI